MDFVGDVRKAMTAFEAEREGIDAERREVAAQERDSLITGKIAGTKLAELDKRASEALSEAQRAIRAALDAYLGELGERYLVTADRLDPDDLAMLANPLVRLGVRDLDALAAKHRGNPVMLDAIHAAADERGVYLSAPHFSREAMEAEATGFASGASDACRELAEGLSGVRFAMYVSGGVSAALSEGIDG